MGIIIDAVNNYTWACFSFPEHKWVKYDIWALCFLIRYEGILISGICCSIFLQASAQGYANTGAVIRISHTGRWWLILKHWLPRLFSAMNPKRSGGIKVIKS